MIEYTSLKLNYDLYAQEYEQAILRVSRSGWYILGPELDAFESEFASYLGVNHCVGLNSGTDALIIAVRALGIGAGDEVIVPAGTYIASVLGITENGATPVYVDSNDYLVMDVDVIEQAITDRTKAILPVHLYGHPCDMNKICDIAERHQLAIIEDCAQCHGSTWNGKKTGTFSTISCFSFYPTKPLGALGDAGCICTDDKMLADKVRMLRNYGSRIKYRNESIGINSRLDEIQAAVLRTGLKHLDEMNEKRIAYAKEYLGIIKNPKVELPKTASKARHVYHLFPVLVEDQKEFQDYLLSQGIKTQIHYPIPPYVAECYRDQKHKWEEYLKAEYIAKHEVSLPLYNGIKHKDIVAIIDAINKY